MTKPVKDEERNETEDERMLRLGEMTPFEIAEQAVSKRQAGSTSMDTQSDFAQFLGDKDVQTVKKHVEKSKWKGVQKQGSAPTQVRVAGSGWVSWEESEEMKKKLKEKSSKIKRKTPKMKFDPKYDSTKQKPWKLVKAKNKQAKKKLRQNWGSDSEISGEEDERVRDSDGSNFSDDMGNDVKKGLEESSGNYFIFEILNRETFVYFLHKCCTTKFKSELSRFYI